ncbi:hypothetical protein SAMN05216327_121102 [Dyadobacter sp. SG02]|uniref:hypothetical protein n=1 Tax=Dyadobacter sp. SG02 TaxID=1855291 RepID=UPI0008C9CF6A|nr:hypothetical protein [Dyadobacter sp. SG02]SEJ81757.1 hypothetical protein SAMN05216327_121102 [Dyadobacter sp. SG02]
MKNVLLFLLFSILSIVASFGQVFPETGAGSSCSNCVPSNKYVIVSGTPDVSDINYYGGTLLKWKNSSLNDVVLPPPPSSQNSGAVNYSTKNFLTLISGPNVDSKVKFTVTQFIPGQKYKMHFAVMASRLLSTTFGSEAVLEIQPSNSAVNLLTSTIDLTGAKNTWMQTYVEFTPTTEETTFILSGNTTVGSGMVNFDIAQRPLDCILPAGKQVDLYKANVQFMYPCQTQNLDLLVKLPWPVGADVVWQLSGYPSGNKLGAYAVQHAGPSANSYKAFYYNNANDCYSLGPSDKSTAEANITYVPQQVPLNLGAVVAVECPKTTYTLKSKLATSADSSRVRWFPNNSHQGPPIANGVVKTPGKYYAFFYSDEFGCYSTDMSTSSVTVSFESPCCQAGTDQVTVQPAAIMNSCPMATADLTTTTLNANVPPNTQIVWFNNPTHTAPVISNPNTVGPGTYYAFIYDSSGAGCYNTDNSTAQVKVTINPCLSNVVLSLKVALQGAMPDAGVKMKNGLQTYGGTGLLPTTSPYTASSAYPSINNAAGPVGEVVDWVWVEVRSGSSPQTVLQAQSLLLKPDGSIVNRNGQPATFNPQSGSVRLVVKYRNHLAIMSNPIQSFIAGSIINYDFTTALSQASNQFNSPNQMILQNGIWCMRAGDLNASQDFIVDGTDGSFFSVQFKSDVFGTYDRADINMDGFVDGVDGSLFNASFYQDIYSTLINY